MGLRATDRSSCAFGRPPERLIALRAPRSLQRGIPDQAAAAPGDRPGATQAGCPADRRDRPRRRGVRGLSPRAARRVPGDDSRARHVRAPQPPLVIITSNRTREVHDALKRRCLYQWIPVPDLREGAGDRAGSASRMLRRAAAQVTALVQSLRDHGAVQGAWRLGNAGLGGGAGRARQAGARCRQRSKRRWAWRSKRRRTSTRSRGDRPGAGRPCGEGRRRPLKDVHQIRMSGSSRTSSGFGRLLRARSGSTCTSGAFSTLPRASARRISASGEWCTTPADAAGAPS